jgi:hypothetical protein
LDSFSGAFELADSRLRSAAALERLYLVAAIAILYATTQGMAVQLAGLRQQVDPKKATRYQLPQNRLAVAIAAFSTNDENCWLPFHFSPKIRSPVLPLGRLSKISMTKFGSPASVP